LRKRLRKCRIECTEIVKLNRIHNVMLGTSKTRKTDVDDAQWLATLARAGLLSGKSERKTLERRAGIGPGIGTLCSSRARMQTGRRNWENWLT
jgi:hypothetical protein